MLSTGRQRAHGIAGSSPVPPTPSPCLEHPAPSSPSPRSRVHMYMPGKPRADHDDIVA